jgi:hypothetical protein
MEIIFLPPAKDELTEAIAFYNSQSEGLVMSLLRKSRERSKE